jgi:hypothetical protein
LLNQAAFSSGAMYPKRTRRGRECFFNPAALVVKFGKSPRHALQLRVLGHKSLFRGEPVKKVTAFFLFVLLGLVLSVPTIAEAGTRSPQQKATKNSQKAYKKTLKQQKKSQKKNMKSQKKATKSWKKQHSSGH